MVKKEVSLDDIANDEGVDVIHIGDEGIVIQEVPAGFYEPKSKTVALSEDLRIGPEFGRTSSAWSNYLREEYNGELRGSLGLQKYDRMVRSDSATRASLRVVNTPIIGGTWFIQPAEETEEHQEIADFVQWNLTEGMTYNWNTVLKEALYCLPFGFYIFEKVWAIREFDGEIRAYLRKMAPRHPLDVVEWHFDSNGGPSNIDFYASPGDAENVNIDISKLAIFTYDQMAGDLRGMSVLRSAYKHWYFKENAYKIDAIQKERHGIGIPIVKLPLGATPKDVEDAKELARNLRTNEKAHAVLPFGWEVMFAKLEGQPVDVLETADHHSKMIFQNVLAQALWSGGGTTVESQTNMDLFYKSSRMVANDIAAVMNSFVIPQLVDFNWEVDRYPQLKVRGLGDTQGAREISFALRNLVGAGIIQVDDRLESWSRELLDSPPHDPTTLRVVSTPQQANVGPPRQSQASNQKIAPGKREGEDGNGTS